MDFFSEFCNICYKTNDRNIKNISEGNMKHLKDTLITFVGHADIINNDTIYLCELCCEALRLSHKFKEMCCSNLIQLRQTLFDMKSKLELEDDTCAVKNTLQIFVQDVLRRNSRENSNTTLSIPAEYHQFVRNSVDLNKNDSICNRQVINLQSEMIKCEFIGDYNNLSLVNSVTKFGETQVAGTNEADNFNESNSLQQECTKEEFEVVKNEIERNSSEDFALRNFENGSGRRFKHGVVVSAVSNNEESVNFQIECMKEEINMKQENSTEDLQLETSGNESNDALNVEESLHEDIRCKEEVKMIMKLRSRSYSNNPSAAIINMQPSLSHGREHRNRRNPTAMHLATHERTCSGEKPYKCIVCQKTFTHLANLVVHERIHTGERPYKCIVCKKMFTQLSSLTAHTRTHSGEKPYKCIVCKKTFTNSSSLTVHQRTHSGERPYKCTVCKKVFTQLANLNTHERTHSGERPYKCIVCKKTFRNSSSLKAHQRIHTGERPYTCTICKKTFTQLPNLTTHERTHSGQRPYKCIVCKKTFTYVSSLAAHKRIHSGERPYKCAVCKKVFAQLANLTSHERTHTGEKPYKCTICKKMFTQATNLTTHERTHTGVRPYKCIDCKKTFTQSSHLIAHKRTHSSDKPYKCTGCKKAFTSSFNLSRHESTHKDD